MDKEPKKTSLQQDVLKKHPFGVPEGYFDSFPDRLKARMEELEKAPVPVRRLNRTIRIRVAVAAAIVILALISYPVIRMTAPGTGSSGDYAGLALMEDAGILLSDYELAALIETGEATPDEEEIYLNQAMEYLAMNDVEMDLIFE